jgi:hypothetical protein
MINKIEKQQANSKRMTVTMANELSTTGSTLEEVNHADFLVFEPEEEDALFLQLKSKATMQADGK